MITSSFHERDDGILRALEVVELNLSKVEFAVLSACETGLGEGAGGEGVLGLQRTFQIAGARTTVTSLWKVDDEATRKLMERFYDNYWKKNMGTLESLREAQLWLLQEGPTRGIGRLEKDAGPRRAPPSGRRSCWRAIGVDSEIANCGPHLQESELCCWRTSPRSS